MKPLSVVISELEGYLAEELDITIEELKALINTSENVTTFADAKVALNNLLKANRSLSIIYAAAKSKLTKTESEEKRLTKEISDRFDNHILALSKAEPKAELDLDVFSPERPRFPLEGTDSIEDLTTANIQDLSAAARAKKAKEIAASIVRERMYHWESVHLAVSKLMECIGREISTMRQLVDLLVTERYGMSTHNRMENAARNTGDMP